MVINWKNNNKTILRNFSENQDLHDVVKILLMRMLRRNYPNSKKVSIYSEFCPEKPHTLYPDVYIDIEGKDKCVFEIQDKWSKDWEIKKAKQYEGIATLIVIKLNDMPSEINKIKKRLEDYVI